MGPGGVHYRVRMPWPHRFPPAVRALLGDGERALCYAWDATGTPVVATLGALLLPDGTRLPWHRIELVEWDDPTLTVSDEAGRMRTIGLDAPGRLPDVAYERVTATIVVSRHVPLAGELGVRIVARRATDADELDWRMRYDDGLDPTDPGVQADAERAFTRVRNAYL